MSSATLADGQLAVAATTIITGITACSAPAGGLGTAGTVISGNSINILFSNRSSTLTETIIISFQRQGGTARYTDQFQLSPNQSAKINNYAMIQGDILLGQTTDATTVDYVVSSGINGAATTLEIYDNTGAKIGGTSSFTAQINKLSLGPAPTDTYSGAMTIDVTKSSHVIAASNTTSAASTFTPSGPGAKGDLLYILTIADSSGTVTVTFAGTFHFVTSTQATTLSHFSTIVWASDGVRWIEVSRTTNIA